MRKIIIFDTTLRDGEQSARAALTAEEKIEIAKQLERLNVDVIEAGFPISSPGDFNAVREIAKKIKKPIICGLARAREEDIERCWHAIKYARKPRIHTFIATSDVHIKHKYKSTREKILKAAEGAVLFAKKLAKGKGEVEFSAEDATRSDVNFLLDVVKAAVNAGANIINIPDTVGYVMPEEFSSLIKEVKKILPFSVMLSVHCHNDLGMAVANSLAAVKEGADQVECTVNGIGERAGNAALEEIVANIRTRADFYNIFTNINIKEMSKSSAIVSKLTGISVQANKAIVGANAFAHSAGIHQDGILKRRETYEIMKPEDYGWKGESIVISARSGTKGIAEQIKNLGYELKKNEIKKVVFLIKELADKKKRIFDDDIAAIIEDEIKKIPEFFSLKHLEVKSGTIIPEAKVILKIKNKIFEGISSGDGPVDAAFKAIEKITKIKTKLENYETRAIGKGKEALGEVTIKIKHDNNFFIGKAASTDIIEASVKAFLNALNKIKAKV